MNGLESLCAVNFGEAYRKIPDDEKQQKRYHAHTTNANIILACLVLESIEKIAREQDLPAAAALGFALSPLGNWRVQRDYAADWARYRESPQYEEEFAEFRRNPGTACMAKGEYDDFSHGMYKLITDIVQRMRESDFVQEACRVYHAARGEEVFKDSDIKRYQGEAEQLTPEQLRM